MAGAQRGGCHRARQGRAGLGSIGPQRRRLLTLSEPAVHRRAAAVAANGRTSGLSDRIQPRTDRYGGLPAPTGTVPLHRRNEQPAGPAGRFARCKSGARGGAFSGRQLPGRDPLSLWWPRQPAPHGPGLCLGAAGSGRAGAPAFPGHRFPDRRRQGDCGRKHQRHLRMRCCGDRCRAANRNACRKARDRSPAGRSPRRNDCHRTGAADEAGRSGRQRALRPPDPARQSRLRRRPARMGGVR